MCWQQCEISNIVWSMNTEHRTTMNIGTVLIFMILNGGIGFALCWCTRGNNVIYVLCVHVCGLIIWFSDIYDDVFYRWLSLFFLFDRPNKNTTKWMRILFISAFNQTFTHIDSQPLKAAQTIDSLFYKPHRPSSIHIHR